MLSKAPPVPQPSPSETPEDQPPKNESDAQTSAQNGEPAHAVEEHHDLPVEDRVVEEHQEVHANANPRPLRVMASTEVRPSNQVLQRQVRRVQRPSDDRLFTLAAVGLTIAIVVLLLKKFMKASGHGAVFMDGS